MIMNCYRTNFLRFDTKSDVFDCYGITLWPQNEILGVKLVPGGFLSELNQQLRRDVMRKIHTCGIRDPRVDTSACTHVHHEFTALVIYI